MIYLRERVISDILKHSSTLKQLIYVFVLITKIYYY